MMNEKKSSQADVRFIDALTEIYKLRRSDNSLAALTKNVLSAYLERVGGDPTFVTEHWIMRKNRCLIPESDRTPEPSRDFLYDVTHK
jgi:hypothetical protein